MAPKQVKVKLEITKTEEESNEVADPMAVSNTPDVDARHARKGPPDEDMPDPVNDGEDEKDPWDMLPYVPEDDPTGKVKRRLRQK